jgi:hypothetical protein
LLACEKFASQREAKRLPIGIFTPKPAPKLKALSDPPSPEIPSRPMNGRTYIWLAARLVEK